MTKTLVLILATAFISACSKTMETKVEGHWHRVNEGEQFNYLSTLDVLDSVAITNRYIHRGDRFSYPRTNEDGIPILPFAIFHESKIFSLSGDTLVISHDTLGNERFVRSDLSKCKLSDAYGLTRLDITLKKGVQTIDLDSSFAKFCTYELFVGRPRASHYDLTDIRPDSFFIQVNDVFITLDRISEVVQELEPRYCDGRRPNVNLHIDSGVSLPFVNRIQNLIPVHISLHNAIETDGGDVGLLKAR